MGMADTLGVTVRQALQAIAATGECLDGSSDWTLFGAVGEELHDSPRTVMVHRTNMLLDKVDIGDEWSTFELVCDVVHTKVDLAVGAWIGVHVDALHHTSNGKIRVDQTVPLWNLPQYHKDMPWNVAHLFSGAYEGWLRAMFWLQGSNQSRSFATHVSVDWNVQVMNTWKCNHQMDYIQSPIPVDFDFKKAYIGVLADVGDKFLPRVTSNVSNLLTTCSPPCPSWSRGGKNSGLASDEGYCFLDGILHLCKTCPIAALFECSDDIEAHSHWRALSAGLQLAGYRCFWSQDVALHQLTGNHRTRWLAVWLRLDIYGEKSRERILCAALHRTPWNDSKHQFALPFELVRHLQLDEQQLNVYGDRLLLPPAKWA